MSRFDAAADSLWAASKATHGDTATYRPRAGDSSAITVLCHLDVVEAGSQFETRSRARTIEIEIGDVARPLQGDQIEVTSGKHVGTYAVTGIDDEDEYSYWCSVG